MHGSQRDWSRSPSPEAGARAEGGMLSSLRHPQFRWLYASNLAFFLAMGSNQIVRPWIAYDLTKSELALGTIMFVVALPMLVMGPLGGAMADRRERRNLIIFGQAVVVAGEAVVLALLALGRLEFWHLLCSSALMGSIFPFIMPARASIVVNVVGKAGLTNAMALNMAGMNATRIVGPAAGGFLIGVVGIVWTYAGALILYLVALACLLGVHRSHPAEDARDRSVGRNMLEGLQYVGQNRLILVLLFFGLVPMFLAMPFQTLLVVFATEIWNVGAFGLGMLSAAAGVGGLVGSMFIAWRSDSHERLRQMMVSMLLFGAFLLAFSVSPWFLLGLPLVFLANIFASVYSTLNNTAIQLLIPDHVRGRVSSFLMMSFSLPMLGTLPMSAVAEVYGAPFAVALASGLAVVAAVLFYAASPALRKMDDSVRSAMLE